MRKPWIVAGMAALFAIAVVVAVATIGQHALAADATTAEGTTAPAATTEQPAEATTTTTEETAPADTAEQPAAADAAPAETTEQPAETVAEPVVEPAPDASEQPAETVAEPVVEPAPDVAAEQTAEPEEGLYPDDRILGSKDAPITMIEYASLSCPHCAAFHAQVMPQLKAEYIDKGHVRFIYRDFPLNWPAVQGALLARCAPDDARYFGLIDTMFKLQNQWLSAKDPGAALMQIGALAGMSKEKIEACFADKAMQDKILMRRQEGEAKYGVESTPSFVINGELYTGGQSFEMLQAAFKELMPKG